MGKIILSVAYQAPGNWMRSDILRAKSHKCQNNIPDTHIILYANYTLIQINTNKDKLNKFGN